MSIFETFRTAVESLNANKLRTLLTMLGVIIGVASVVALLSIGAGVSSNITSRINGMGTNMLSINTDNRQANARLTNADVRALDDPLRVPDVTSAIGEVRGNAKVMVGTNLRNTTVQGEMPGFFAMRNINMDTGSIYTDDDNTQRRRVAVLGYSLAQTLFNNSALALGQTVMVDTTPFQVVGVAEQKGGFGPQSGDDTIYVPLNVAQEKLFVRRNTGLDSVSTIYAQIRSADVASSATQDISRTLRSAHNLLPTQADDFRVFNQAELASTLDSVAATLTEFLGAIGAISLLVGGIGIMNIMLVSVTERTREIGVRKAIGAARGAILLQFLIESLTVSASAGVIGLLLGMGISLFIGSQGSFKSIIEPQTVAIAFGFSVLIGVVFGLYPAWRASRLQPVEALRYE